MVVQYTQSFYRGLLRIAPVHPTSEAPTTNGMRDEALRFRAMCIAVPPSE